MSNGRGLPKDVIDLWPEVFDEVSMNVVPLNYVHTIEITFKNTKVWIIDFKKNSKIQSWETFEKEVKSMIKEYEDDISDIEFKLDTDKIKRDIRHSTKKFLKKLK